MEMDLEMGCDAADNPCAELLVRAWRRIMVSGAECPLVAREFTCVCGADGKQVFNAFCTFLCALAFAQRRCLLVNPPGVRKLTIDETRMLTLVAAAQNGCAALLEAHLSWLAQRTLRSTLRQSVHELAEVLGASRLCLPAPA